MKLAPLPIDEVLPGLVEALKKENCAVVHAPTGAGKTTRVPSAILDAGLLEPGARIVMLEPRRVAARAAARRIAAERGVRLGGEVGYQVRFDRRAGPETRILIVTEGVLVRILQADPFLEGIGALVFDEFHERSLNVDLALAMTRRVQNNAREDLRVVVMSATLDPGPIAAFLGGCPELVSAGRTYPVELRYLERASALEIPELAAQGVQSALAESEGDVLVFLPGVGEIRRSARILSASALGPGVDLVELYGDLSPEAQDDALRVREGRRKVVLATNVAETSLTIPGVRSVVDVGYARVMRFDPNTGLDRLELRRVSRASADQRAGRAGREAPGLCLRMWPEHIHRSLSDFEEPEIRRVDLCAPALEILAWGEPSVEDFPWYEAPEAASLGRALRLLEELGALDIRGVTALGQRMVRWPIHPRLARLMVEAHSLGHAAAGAWLAALLAERGPFVRGASFGGRASASDVLDRLDVARGAAGRQRDPRVHRGGLRNLDRARKQLESVGRRVMGQAPRASLAEEPALLRSILAAFPDRVARRREAGGLRAQMVGGRGVALSPDSAVKAAELFVCVSLDVGERGARADARVRQASAVERGWLRGVSTAIEVVFDEEKRRVMAVQCTRYGDLLLSSQPARAPDPTEAAELLASRAVSQGEVPWLEDDGAATLVARVRCLAAWMPDLGLPTFEGESLEALMMAGARGRRSFAELRKAPWSRLVLEALDWRQRAALEREAPERIEVPSGSAIRLRYEVGGPPVLAVRIQEVFGMADTPRVAGGRVAVVMHLLAPNMRPQQVTADLRSFWDTTYSEVRKELRQRYPKHAWPEDPWEAKAQRRPGRRRRT